MRSDVFYWKCDNPTPVEAKRSSYFADKYNAETDAQARAIIQDFVEGDPGPVERLAVDGNHFTYRFAVGGKTLLLRTDDGTGTDSYMLAESAILRELQGRGLPVPGIHATDVTLARFPLRYQIMDFVEAPSLTRYYQEGTLDTDRMARAFGDFLGRLHERTAPGFGFLDCHVLAESGSFQGIDHTWAAYFNKCLARHLGYLRDHDLLSANEITRIDNAFSRHSALLDCERGSLLHRDFAYWNILGTPTSITAVIDWDDAVIGDPADDLGIVQCFNGPGYMERLLDAYTERQAVDDSFRTRIDLYTLRNMLWKTMIRHYMGYFERGKDFFLSTNEANLSLRDYSLAKIRGSLNALENA